MSEDVLFHYEELTKRRVKWFKIDSKFIYSNELLRLDPPQYEVDVYLALEILEKSNLRLEKLGELSNDIFAPPPVKRHFVKEGIPYLTPKELFDFKPAARKYVLRNLIDNIDNWYVKKDWIVVSQSGNVGRVIFIGNYLKDFVISQNALRIVPKNGIYPGYIFAYLSSWIGQALIKKDKYGVTVKHLSPQLLSNIPIPRIDRVKLNGKVCNMEVETHNKISYATKMRDTANKILEYAERLFYKYTGLPPISENNITYMNQSQKQVFEISANDIIASSGSRMDSTNYDPIVKTIENNLTNSNLKITTIEEFCRKIFIPARFKRIYVEKEYGVPYIRPSHLPMIKYYDQGYLSKTFTKNIDTYLLELNDILLTTDGTVGNISFVTKTIKGFFGSNNIARITPKSSQDRGYIGIYLMIGYGRLQLKKEIYGGVIDHINEEHIKSVKIPLLKPEHRQHIGKWVVLAFELKDKAITLENDAIFEVEEIISKKF